MLHLKINEKMYMGSGCEQIISSLLIIVKHHFIYFLDIYKEEKT